MKLSPTEIFKGQKIFFIGGTGRSEDTLVLMSAKHEEYLVGGTGDADRSFRAPYEIITNRNI